MGFADDVMAKAQTFLMSYTFPKAILVCVPVTTVLELSKVSLKVWCEQEC